MCKSNFNIQQKRFVEFISQIKLIEVMIFSKEYLAPQLDIKMDANIIDSQSQGVEKDNQVFGTEAVRTYKDDVEKRINEIAPFARKEFSNKVDLKITKNLLKFSRKELQESILIFGSVF